MKTSTLIPALLATVLMPFPVASQEEWDDEWADDPWAEDVSPWSWHGFVEGAAGLRLQTDHATEEDMPVGEARLQLEADYTGDRFDFEFKADGVADGVLEKFDLDVREAMFSFGLGKRSDIRLGRQVLTWGTGDLLFLNDLFPKDWVSFLSGRDNEYLKAPSDALRVSWYGENFNIDTALTPRFEPDRYLTGERLSFFDPMRRTIVAAPPKLHGRLPANTIENTEVAIRLYDMVGAHEWALYGYRGFFPQPTAYDPAQDRYTFARMNSVGASLRGPLAGGLYKLETAYYDSSHDRDGDNPNIPNSELRFLAGYETELVTNLTLGTQYYVEWLQDHAALERNWPFDPGLAPDEFHHVITMRLTWRMMRDNLILGLMNFYSPSENDYFIRPTMMYRFSDQLQFNAGLNLFGGEEISTFYGQFEDNSSAFARLRFSF